MKKTILLAVLILTAHAVYAGGGWASCAVKVTANGGSMYQFLLNNEGWTDGDWGANTPFDAYNFGTPTSLILNGGSGNGWTDDSPGYTTSSFVIYYRVYLTSGSPGAWNSITLNTLEYLTGNNYIYSKSDAGIDILDPVRGTPGAYTFEVVMAKDQFYGGGDWNSMVPGGQAIAYNASSAGYKATFTVAVLPVQLTEYSARLRGDQVSLEWSTATETNNYGFEVERSANAGASWTCIGFVEGHGTTSVPQQYACVDKPGEGVFQYRLKQIDRDGRYEYSQSVDVNVAAAPVTFDLQQNYPNPFNPSTKIRFSIPSGMHVVLKVYSILGREVLTLVNEFKDAGSYAVPFNASSLANGVYFYKLTAGQYSDVKRMTVMK